jgi:hypothetical protein
MELYEFKIMVHQLTWLDEPIVIQYKNILVSNGLVYIC